jgi:hypothetical protein
MDSEEEKSRHPSDMVAAGLGVSALEGEGGPARW